MSWLKEQISGNVTFISAQKEGLYYKTETGFVFFVPFEDMGDGIFLAKDKGIMFMRYIRKHKEMIDAALKQQNNG